MIRTQLLARRLLALDGGSPPPPAPPAAPTPPATPPAPAAPPAGDPPPATPPVAPPAPATPPAGDPPPATPPAAPPAAPPAPIVLTLPKDSGLDPAVLERTTAIASALHLSQDDAQKTLDFLGQEAKAHADKVVAEAIQSHQPGGAAWEKQNADWQAAALVDPVLGDGKPEQLQQRAELGKRVLATFFPAETIDFLEKTGLASHPATLKGLVKIGQMMREDQLVVGTPAPKAKSTADVLYGETK